MNGLECAKEIGVKSLAEYSHAHRSNRIQQSMTGVVYPDIDALKVVHGKSYDAINLFAISNIARQCQRLILMAKPRPRCFQAARITREQHHLRAMLDKFFGNRLANSH